METALQVFNNTQFGAVRTVEDNGNILFCGSDVAKALGYARPNEAITQHCKGTVKHSTPTNGGMQELLFIPEGDVYRLIIKSQLPTAEKFEQWVFNEVLPSIRKRGIYATDNVIDNILSNPDLGIKLLTELKTERANRMSLQAKVQEDKPKVTFANAVSASNTTILIGDLAKILKQNGIDMGQKRLFAWLRDNGYLIKRSGADYNSPTQRAMELGLFVVKETIIPHYDHTTISKTTKVTGKGQIYVINKFKEQHTPPTS